jgi:hypothetical protein
MGGAYGNVPALTACIAHAGANQCDTLAFLGDSTGFCGHSDQTLQRIRRHFAVRVAGNLEKQAAADSSECGCNYSSAEDERLGCAAHQYAIRSLSLENRLCFATWPELVLFEMDGGSILLCHGSPDKTNEFLYESELDEGPLVEWLDKFEASGVVCTHSGLPWIRHLWDGRFAKNCGVVGKPDNDGDLAVHYGVIEKTANNPCFEITIERVEYDSLTWAEQLKREGVADVFIEPLRTGWWTCGLESLPPTERKLEGQQRRVASALAV